MHKEEIRASAVQGFDEALTTPNGWVSDGLAFTEDWGVDLGQIRAETWLWHGRQDEYAPPTHSEWLARHIERAKLSIGDCEGHFAAYTKQARAILWAAHLTDEPEPELEPQPVLA